MARPRTKTDLLIEAQAEFARLFELINEMNKEEQNTLFQFSAAFLEKKKEAHWQRDKNLRDVLIHLYEWHQLLLNWVNSNQKGENQPFLPEPYNWRTYGEMNVGFVEKHQKTTLAQAKEMLKESHQQVMALINGFSNEELFAKKQFAWAASSPVGSYFVSSTSSHYLWANKKIKQYIKEMKNSKN